MRSFEWEWNILFNRGKMSQSNILALFMVDNRDTRLMKNEAIMFYCEESETFASNAGDIPDGLLWL